MANLLALTNLQNGLFTFILGLCIVFGGMLIIVCAVSIAGKILSRKAEKGSEKKSAPVAPVAPVEAPVATQPAQEDEIPEHVRVAIIAAIAAYYENNQPQNEFRVRKIKKLNNR